HLDARRDFRLRKPAGVDHWILTFDLLPLEALFIAGRVEALAILPGNVEQASRHFRTHVAVAQFKRRRFNGERAAVFRDQLLLDLPGAMADDALGMLAQKRQAGADAVRRIMHRREALPVARPAFHVLLMAAAQ